MPTNFQKVDLASGDLLLVTVGARLGTPEQPIVGTPEHPIARPQPPDLSEIKDKLREVIDSAKGKIREKLQEIKDKLEGLEPAHPIEIPEGGRPRPPIFWPGNPDQGLPPMVGWPLPEEPGIPEQPLPPTVEHPIEPGRPGRPGRPGHPIERPPVLIPGKPEQGLPPMIGWPLPEEECQPSDPNAGIQPLRR